MLLLQCGTDSSAVAAMWDRWQSCCCSVGQMVVLLLQCGTDGTGSAVAAVWDRQ